MPKKKSVVEEMARLLLDGLKKAPAVTLTLKLSRTADGNGAIFKLTRRLHRKPPKAKARR